MDAQSKAIIDLLMARNSILDDLTYDEDPLIIATELPRVTWRKLYSPLGDRKTFMPNFSHDDWEYLLENTFSEIRNLAKLKGGEYSGDTDRLANFRRNSAALGLPMETIWAVYAAKHWDAIMQYIRDEQTATKRERLESIEGRVDDLLVYALLFKAMLAEGKNNRTD